MAISPNPEQVASVGYYIDLEITGKDPNIFQSKNTAVNHALLTAFLRYRHH